jgi:hypothetical protein
MPIEHEHKVVLRDWDAFHRALAMARVGMGAIEQFYLDGKARLRRIEHDPPIGNLRVERTFTFKQAIGGRLLELEMDVSEEDYGMARAAAVSSLFKHRFRRGGRDGHVWDLDFLFTARPEEGGSIYFAMAEVETEEGADWSIPSFLAPYVALVVPREHGGQFTNARLSDPAYARHVLETVVPDLAARAGGPA